MAPKRNASASGASSSAAASESLRSYQKRWYSFKSHWSAADRVNTAKGQEVQHLAEYLKNIKTPKERDQLPTQITTTAKTISEVIDGMITAGRVAEINSMKVDFYSDMEVFKSAIMTEIRSNQQAAGVWESPGSDEPSTDFWTAKWQYKSQGMKRHLDIAATETTITTEGEMARVMAKKGAKASGIYIESLDEVEAGEDPGAEDADRKVQEQGGRGRPYMDLPLPSYTGYLRQPGPRAGHDLL
eukprot:6325515-Amphidinium_carterae.1